VFAREGEKKGGGRDGARRLRFCAVAPEKKAAQVPAGPGLAGGGKILLASGGKVC
jgi:hypothetical protein